MISDPCFCSENIRTGNEPAVGEAQIAVGKSLLGVVAGRKQLFAVSGHNTLIIGKRCVHRDIRFAIKGCYNEFFFILHQEQRIDFFDHTKALIGRVDLKALTADYGSILLRVPVILVRHQKKAHRAHQRRLERCALAADVSYCLSDTFADAQVLQYCKFAVIQTRDYRAYITNPDGKITKDSVLYKLIKAGSVFIIKDNEDFGGLINKDNCQLAGFNCIVAKEKKV